MTSIGREWGGPPKVQDMLNARGVSLILKSIFLDFKRPVVYPDTLLVAHKPHTGPLSHLTDMSGKKSLPPTHFYLKGAIWSCAQGKIVTECDSVIVWYDYDRLKKCDPGLEALEILKRRMHPEWSGSDNSSAR